MFTNLVLNLKAEHESKMKLLKLFVDAMLL